MLAFHGQWIMWISKAQYPQSAIGILGSHPNSKGVLISVPWSISKPSSPVAIGKILRTARRTSYCSSMNLSVPASLRNTQQMYGISKCFRWDSTKARNLSALPAPVILKVRRGSPTSWIECRIIRPTSLASITTGLIARRLPSTLSQCTISIPSSMSWSLRLLLFHVTITKWWSLRPSFAIGWTKHLGSSNMGSSAACARSQTHSSARKLNWWSEMVISPHWCKSWCMRYLWKCEWIVCTGLSLSGNLSRCVLLRV